MHQEADSSISCKRVVACWVKEAFLQAPPSQLSASDATLSHTKAVGLTLCHEALEVFMVMLGGFLVKSNPTRSIWTGELTFGSVGCFEAAGLKLPESLKPPSPSAEL